MHSHDSTAPTAWVGIDTGRDPRAACRWPPPGRPRARSSRNDATGHAALRAGADAQAPGAGFCLESTGAYGTALATTLAGAGRHGSVVNPARIKYAGLAPGHGHQTDQADARLLAQYARARRPPAGHPAPAETLPLPARGRRRDDLLRL